MEDEQSDQGGGMLDQARNVGQKLGVNNPQDAMDKAREFGRGGGADTGERDTGSGMSDTADDMSSGAGGYDTGTGSGAGDYSDAGGGYDAERGTTRGEETTDDSGY